MIRDRLERDLGPLSGLLRSVGHPEPGLDDSTLRRWLTERDPEQVWVFDQAPVSVVPTSRVVGHVEIGPFRTDDRAGHGVDDLADHLGVRPHDLWRIGGPVVGGRHAEQVARFLVRESLRYVAGRGGVPLLDHRTCWAGSVELVGRLGLSATPAHVAGGRYAARSPRSDSAHRREAGESPRAQPDPHPECR